jgi:UDP-glucose 4-epimerase
MAILVTGGAGYIGSHVSRHLYDAGVKVVILDDFSTGHRESIIHNETLVEGDLRDPAVLDLAFSENKIECVMHFAALAIVPDSVRDPLKYYSNNVTGMTNLLSACKKYDVKKFIFSSTAAVYGSPPNNGVAHEEDPRKPENPYGASKAMAERILKDYAASSKLNYAILRYFNVAGADPEGRLGQRSKVATHLIKICCEAATGLRKHVEIFGEDYGTLDGTCVRDYVHIEDLSSAHLLALDYISENSTPLTINVGYGKGLSVKDIIEATWRVTGKSFKVKIAKRRPGDPETLIANVEKIKSLGWKPKHSSIEKIITDAFNFEKSLHQN